MSEPIRNIHSEGEPGSRVFTLRSGAKLRDGVPFGGERKVRENPGRPWVETGGGEIDGLYALALEEAAENSVDEIGDKSYRHGEPLRLDAFETGKLWHYVWTRDLSYACDLGMARFDPARAISALRFKVSPLKAGVGGLSPQIVQDTGSGGSYPVSTDRVAWALGARAAVLEGPDAADFLPFAYEALARTLEQDAVLVRDPADGLYRGETSFLDWREQTYPEWTARDVLPIARAKALSTNILYFAAMKTAAGLARKLGRDDGAEQWGVRADELRSAIRAKFFAKLPPPAFILCGDTSEVAVPHRDLLGESLAILHGVAERDEARHLSESYPLGPHGPSVVWPNSRAVPIYHNLGIWPFVTAYYTKAALSAGNARGVAEGFRSLAHGAGANLSNMENLNWADGAAFGIYEGLKGPVINSPRQLWSVAGFLSAVQDVLFGFEATEDGVAVRPSIPRALKDEFFPGQKEIRLRNLMQRGRRHDITVHFPEGPGGEFRVESVTLNGKKVSGCVPYGGLASENHWDVQLAAADGRPGRSLRMVPPSDTAKVFFPSTPFWRDEGVFVEGARVMLKYGGAGKGEEYRIYRDGKIAASGRVSSEWEDPQPLGLSGPFPEYAVAVVDPATGHVSHPSPFRRAVREAEKISARFEGNGSVAVLDIPRDGDYILAFRYANGAGEIGTGITCGIRRVEVSDSNGKVVHQGYAIFPQTGGPGEFRRSSPLCVALGAGRHEIRLLNDDRTVNMSGLAANEGFTEFAGGGGKPFNEVTVESALCEPR